MNSFENLISSYVDEYPEFSYYLKHAAEIRNHAESYPDIAIECCTSLLQGLSKAIYYRLDPAPDKDKFETDKLQFQVKTALKLLQGQSDAFEIAFPQACETLARLAGELRNRRGDISHGRDVPKELQSDASLARLAMEITEALARYMFSNFVLINELPATYSDNPEFNEELDQEGPHIGISPYSKLLYDNDFDAYTYRLDQFRAAQEDIL